MNRLAAYVFWEKDGIVREYVVRYIKGLTEVASKVYVVANGEIQPEGKRRLEEECGAVVLQRPNVGVDFWAYKTALDQEGDAISDYDEIILCNCSCYGPVYPFSEMFDEMAGRQVDFWGITEWPTDADGFKGTWILSYFFVFRPHLFLSPEWAWYWKNLSEVHSREECIEKHETQFTAYFADKGFTYDVYCPNLPGYLDMTIEAPDELVVEQRCPLIKRKAFCTDYDRFLSYHRGTASRRVFDYIRDHHLYDTDIIVDDMLATQHGAYLKDCLQLDYVLSTRHGEPLARQPRVAALCYLTQEELLDESFRYLLSMPAYADLYIVTDSDELAGVIREKAVSYRFASCRVSVMTPVGGAVEALLLTARESLTDYDYVCAIHDGQLPDPPVGHISEEIRRFSTEALLASSVYAANILAVFENNPRLGVLIPMNALHSTYRARYGQEWGLNYDGTVKLLERAGVSVPISPAVPPLSPMEAMFWFRPACLDRLLKLELSDADFKAGNPDGSLYHNILRAIPFFAQDAGFLTGQVISVEGAENHIINLAYLLGKVNAALLSGSNRVYVPMEVNIGLKRSLKEYLKKHLPARAVSVLRRMYHWLPGR